MFQNHDEPQNDKDSHEQVLRLADEALSEAGEAIRVARDKLRVAKLNYSERMKLPTLRPIDGQPKSSKHI